MQLHRVVEYVFFFGLIGVVGYLVWSMLEPFVSALALAAIIVTICYPLYLRILRVMPRQSETLAALATTVSVIAIIFVPVFFLASALLSEALSMYNETGARGGSFEQSLASLEANLQAYAPGFELNAAEYARQGAGWLAAHVGTIFAGTASTIFAFFIAMIGSFYLFRDGRRLTEALVAISPLPEGQDKLILSRLAVAVRSVATGTLAVALIQGTLTGFGLWLFGFERAVLWGTIAAIGALIPGVGTAIVFIPAVIFLLVSGSYVAAAGLAVWGMLAVGLIDNLLGPYLMSRGNALHPFIILLAVLGGLSVFGPIGFVVGPVIVSLFKVLLELYATEIRNGTPSIRRKGAK